jgi:putative NADPH-quinone reductase
MMVRNLPVQPKALPAATGFALWNLGFPLWLASMPALLKGFFEQALRPGFALGPTEPGRMWKKLLKGRSARIVVTMGMPALVYRWYLAPTA